MSPLVTVAIVSWNTKELLGLCLRSLQAEAGSGRTDVCVVDNGSTDGSRELVRDSFPWARLFTPDVNLGFGPAVNLVASHTESQWIAPANADIELTPGALDALLEAGAADPGAGVVAPRLILPDGTVQPSVQGFPSLRRRLLFHTRVRKLVPRLGERLLLGDSWNPEQARRVDWATGAFTLVRREAFDRIGGFARDQWMYAEDLDLCWRLAKAGWATRYEPTAIVHHHHSAAASQAFGESEVVRARWMRATYAWMAARRGIAFTWAHAGLDLIEASLRFTVLSTLSLVSPRRWSARRDRARAAMPLFRLGLSTRDRLLREAHRPPGEGSSID